MKHEYTEMDVRFVGAVSNVVNKSGTYCDNSSNWETKSPDQGIGNCDQPGQR